MKLNSQSIMLDLMLNDKICKKKKLSQLSYLAKSTTQVMRQRQPNKKQPKSTRVKLLSTIPGHEIRIT